MIPTGTICDNTHTHTHIHTQTTNTNIHVHKLIFQKRIWFSLKTHFSRCVPVCTTPISLPHALNLSGSTSNVTLQLALQYWVSEPSAFFCSVHLLGSAMHAIQREQVVLVSKHLSQGDRHSANYCRYTYKWSVFIQ